MGMDEQTRMTIELEFLCPNEGGIGTKSGVHSRVWSGNLFLPTSSCHSSAAKFIGRMDDKTTATSSQDTIICLEMTV
jgi:hypothetical protein